MNKENIPLLDEVIKAYKEGTLDLPEDKDKVWFTVYPTKSHRESDNQWWFPFHELEAYIKVRDEQQKKHTEFINKLIWSK